MTRATIRQATACKLSFSLTPKLAWLLQEAHTCKWHLWSVGEWGNLGKRAMTRAAVAWGLVLNVAAPPAMNRKPRARLVLMWAL